MKRKKLFSIIAIAIFTLITGCAKDDFQEIVGICPIVIATSPIDGATSVPEKKVITATFNTITVNKIVQ